MVRRALAKAAGSDLVRRLVPGRLVQALFFRREQRLYDGKLATPSAAPSVLFFTVHKCASTFVPQALGYFNEREQLGLIEVNLPAWVRKISALDPAAFMTLHAERLFRPRGVLYAPLRRYVPVPGREAYRTILMLRDPRDVLVSQYYSVAYSHRLPFRSVSQERFEAKRASARASSIDDYVMDECAAICGVYEEYAQQLFGAPGVALLRYEDMMQDPGAWVSGLARALGVACNESDVRFLTSAGRLTTHRVEDATKHLRSGTPGDHRRKLQPATIDALTSRLTSVLVPFGYESSATARAPAEQAPGA
jgi:hypothetical protein